MGDGFFNNPKGFGSMFDRDHDGKLGGSELGPLAAFGSMAAHEMLKATEEDSEGKKKRSGKSDKPRKSQHGDPGEPDEPEERKRKHVDLSYDNADIALNLTSDEFQRDDADELARQRIIHDRVMAALWCDDHKKKAIREAIDDALFKRVRFSPSDISDLSEVIKDESQLAELIATAEPFFPGGDIPTLSGRWSSGVFVEYRDGLAEVTIDGDTYEFPDPDYP